MSSSALNQIANALQNGIGIGLNLTGYTWEAPAFIGQQTANSSIFTSLNANSANISTITIANGIQSTAIGTITSNVAAFTSAGISTLTATNGNFTTLTANTLSTGSLTVAAINPSSITTNNISAGTLVVQVLNPSTLNVNTISANTQTLQRLTTSTIQTNTISVPTITLTSLNAISVNTALLNTAIISTGAISTSILGAAQINTSTLNVNTLSTTSLTVSTMNITNGFSNTGVTSVAEIVEILTVRSSLSGTTVFDWTSSAVWYLSSLTSNVSASITNLPTTPNRSLVVTLIINQGATPYYASTLICNGSLTPIRWASATTPTPTASRVEVESFTLFYVGSTWSALGQYTSFA